MPKERNNDGYKFFSISGSGQIKMKHLITFCRRILRCMFSKLNFLLLLIQPTALDRNLHLGQGIKLFVPVRCDGKGIVKIGSGTTLGFPSAARAGNGEILVQARTTDSRIEIGTNVSFSNNISLIALHKISIGNDCLIGDSVSIMDSDFHGIDPETRRTSTGGSLPVVIGNNTWLGSRVIVLKGVTIGENSVIAPLSVVTRDIPENSVAGGNPAKVIKAIG